ncbi:DUF262 domain-containing protein [Acinetobacter baumannii]|uniref:DUF262 domain-containing protein n=1 Tax=Acinetobacter baumannii TaxID=470 RepID=A0AAP1QV59_ACIBA|nr:DUF262 domain-containing protein [Acinetobacter baumannii]MBD2849090.1 DUF262 domain-containing protein [Acinetobacter baumannii]MBD3132774.1 DUF262 domain-containing protein [Acinetobacter baumannii]MBE0306575.1 DUF262 domain-containing protein [Acinetobacter baumannii]MBE0311881.1 DUF262 domain-containing protein [Acinetobacter baumannii]MBE0329386.1 DUF262 domain-containing protein [Acinetobacter baumannii]
MEVELLKQAEEQIQSFSKKIDFYTSEYTVEILAKKIAEKEYTVPNYQREFTWDEPRKCKFIESLLIGLPIPFVFFWMNDETGQLEIVDGSQRLRTIEEYLNNRLTLSGLERLDLLNGTKFQDLPLARRRKILNISLRGIILSEDTDMEARVDLFERINTGSQVANPAEVRRGALQGSFMDFVTELAKDPLFNKLAPVSKKQEKVRESEELVARFFAYTDGLDGYKDDVSPFLFRYIKKMNKKFDEDPNLKNVYQERFVKMLNFVDKSFTLGFRKTEKSQTTPRARFESISVGVSEALAQKPDLVVDESFTNSILESQGFKNEIRSDGANAIRRLKGRIGFMRDALLAGA